MLDCKGPGRVSRLDVPGELAPVPLPTDDLHHARSRRPPPRARRHDARRTLRARPGSLRSPLVRLGRLARRSVEGAARTGHAAAAGRGSRSRRPSGMDTRALRGGEGQPVRAQAGAAHGAAPGGRFAAGRGRPRHRSRHPRGAVADAHARRPDPRRAACRRGGTADPRRRQPRHRRVGPGRVPRLLGAGAGAARAGQHRPADARRRRVVRVQRRSRARHPRARAARSRDHPLRHHVEIVRDRGDARQCGERTIVAAGARSARAST